MIRKLFWILNAFFLRIYFKKIGNYTYIGKTIFVIGGKRVSLGNKVRIFPGLRIETHLDGKILIDNDVSIGQNFHIISANEELKIGAHTTLSGNVFVTNIDHDYEAIGIHILKQKYISKNTLIGENCFVGYGAVIQAGTILGKQCVVGANSVVRGIFPDYCVIVGAPAKIVKRYNSTSNKWEKTDNSGNFLV